MKRSTERILTTHVGSLASPKDLLEIMDAKLKGERYDNDAYNKRVRSAVAEVVRKQVECGGDIVTDGEQGKASFNAYVVERLNGFEPVANAEERIAARMKLNEARAEEVFMPAIAPGFWNNKFYRTEEEFQFALADAMRVEYLAIVDAGFILQIDDPSLTRLFRTEP
jgi:5-methyltetrahydropteroyltriglutamate--homocysteine methyltransferase